MRLSVATNFDPAPVSRKRLAEHVREAKSAEISFNDLLNASCLGNRKLDGFIERFREKGCRDVECEACRWCHDFAAKAVRVDPEESRQALAAYDELFRSLDGGAMWRYLPGGNGVGDP